tara:strand:- start:2146 stop:3231 length:1086 start_codon:yes stop_codon:yes gene_type:complete
MKIFRDYHHDGSARGHFQLFCNEFDAEVGIPDVNMCSKYSPPGIWGVFTKDSIPKLGLEEIYNRDKLYEVNEEQFMDIDWNIILITRHESQDILFPLLNKHPYRHKMKIIAYTGNDEIPTFDWRHIKHFISSCDLNYMMCPNYVNKIWFPEIIGDNYFQDFVPVDDTSLYYINSFINFMKDYDELFTWDYERFGRGCPHCGSRSSSLDVPVNIITLWQKMVSVLPDYTFTPYGAENEFLNGKLITDDREMPSAYHSGALTWHMRTAEGFGLSLHQSIVCGRPVIIPKKFYKYRTGNRYLIPDVTCVEVDWNIHSITSAIKKITVDVDTANQYAKRCYDIANALFDYTHDIWRLKQWIYNIL